MIGLALQPCLGHLLIRAYFPALLMYSLHAGEGEAGSIIVALKASDSMKIHLRVSWVGCGIGYRSGSGSGCHPPFLSSLLLFLLAHLRSPVCVSWLGRGLRAEQEVPLLFFFSLACVAVKHAKQLAFSAHAEDCSCTKTPPYGLVRRGALRKGAKPGASPVCAEMYVCMCVCVCVCLSVCT